MTSARRNRGTYVAPARTLVLIGVFLTAFGGFGAWHFLRSLDPLSWKTVSCKVVRFEPKDDQHRNPPFFADVRFEFEWNGRHHTGTSLGIGGWKESREAWRHALRFKENAETTCHLPTGNPANAVLFRPAPAWGGLAFVGFALAIGWTLLVAHRRRDHGSTSIFRGVAPAIVLLFGTPGLLLTTKLSVPVWWECLQAANWQPTAATVVWSQLRSQDNRNRRNSRTTHFRADICYEYQAGGRTWRQNRLFPGNFSAGGSGTARKLIDEYPAGTKITCLVDPANPGYSLLKPNPGWSLLFTLFPLPFLAVAVITLRQALKSSTAIR